MLLTLLIVPYIGFFAGCFSNKFFWNKIHWCCLGSSVTMSISRKITFFSLAILSSLNKGLETISESMSKAFSKRLFIIFMKKAVLFVEVYALNSAPYFSISFAIIMLSGLFLVP